MAYLLLLVCAYLAAVVDTAMGEALAVRGIAPDLVALTAVAWVVLVRGRWSFLVAGAVALLGDLIAPGRVGVGAAWMLLAAYGLAWVLPRVPGRKLAVRLALASAALTVWCLGVAGTNRLLGEHAMTLPRSFLAAWGAALYTSAMAVPVFMAAGWVRVHPEDRV